jgi:hypothetical protein
LNNPETRFIQSVHRRLKQLPEPPIIRKIADRFTQGWPDVLYIGPSGICLWVEYKVHPNKPTALQSETINMLCAYKQKTAIITKTPTSCMIFDGTDHNDNAEPWGWIAHQLGYLDYASTKTRRQK